MPRPVRLCLAGIRRHLDLDHVRAPIRELLDASRASADARQVDYAEMGQSFHEYAVIGDW